jgi:hypothetical protein
MMVIVMYKGFAIQLPVSQGLAQAAPGAQVLWRGVSVHFTSPCVSRGEL